MGVPKTQTLHLRLSDEDRARLEAVAEHYSLGMASVIRMLIKRERDRIDAEYEADPNYPGF